MKRAVLGLATIFIVFLSVFAVFLGRPLHTAKASRGCSNRTVMGNYGWSEFGMEPETKGTPFWTMAGLAYFDGNENFTGTQGYMVTNGVPTPPGATTGTYHVDSDCTITITYDFESETYTDHGVVVGPNGSEIMAVESSSGSDTTGKVDLKRLADWE